MAAEEQAIEIAVDHREERSGVTAILEALPNVTVDRAALEIGDYGIAPGVFVERKSAADFSASIVDRRMFQQVAAAKERGVVLMVLLEGDPLDAGRLHDNAVIGAISYLAVIEGLRIVSVPSVHYSAQMLATMARHAQNGLGYEIQMRAARPKSVEEQQVYLLCGLPGVGLDKARKLLAHFGSVGDVLQADVAALCQVEGVAKKGAEKIRGLVEHSG